MRIIYTLGIHIYFNLVYLAALRNRKARRFIMGRKDLFEKLNTIDGSSSDWVWFHVASLGEFEQARPVIEMVRKEFEEVKILISFYSPSGFEVRKHYRHADFITYLPFDTPANARRFIQSFSLKLVCFVKGDYWFNFLHTLNQSKIPVINFAARFRSKQLFFKPWGRFYRNFLFQFDHILVQDERSLRLLKRINYRSALVAGDTRFDRVLETFEGEEKLSFLSKFKSKQQLIVFGSVWPEDLKLVFPIVKDLLKIGVKLIIAPHEIDEATLKSIKSGLPGSANLFSEKRTEGEIMVVDTIGNLAEIYRYADLVYIGGAFRGTLHNLLEPAVFGMPILFGEDKRNKKFPEAVDLVNLGAANEVGTSIQLNNKIQQLLEDVGEREKLGQIARDYITKNCGASEKTMGIIRQHLSN